MTTWPNGDVLTKYSDGYEYKKFADGTYYSYDTKTGNKEEVNAKGDTIYTYPDGSKYKVTKSGLFEEIDKNGKVTNSGDLTKFVPCTDCALWGGAEDTSANGMGASTTGGNCNSGACGFSSGTGGCS